jgi:hypothetical protein
MSDARLVAETPLSLSSGVPAFAREHQRITAALARCEPRDAVLDAARYAPAAVTRAQRMWRGFAISEYESSSVFAQLAVQTMEAAAPVDVTATVLRMAQDELRHAELCLGVAAALDPREPPPPVPAAFTALSRHPGRPAEERALRNVVYGCCLSETVNAARFVQTLDAASDPFVRETVRRLLADEAQHAHFGFLYLELFRPWIERHAEAREAVGRFLRRAFGVLEQNLAAPPADFHAPDADEIALGLPTAEGLRATFYDTVEQAIVPALDAFGLDATAAWRERSAAPA